MSRDDVRRAAAARGFDAATVAAVVEVESNGAPFGADGRPTIKHEGHVAWRNAPPAIQALLRAAGLAWPAYDRARDKDRPTQAARWEWFAAVEDIAGRDVAIMACSWGAGQVLGENWRMCGYASAQHFERAQATEAGQIETMLRYLEGADMAGAIAARDWRAIALAYNGPRNVATYAPRLEAAYRRITGGRGSPVVLRVGSQGADVRRLQSLIGEKPDGYFGPRTKAAVEAAQRERGLVADGVVGAKTWAALGERPAVQPAPAPTADIAAQAGKVTAAAGAATAAVKGLTELSDALAPYLAQVEPWMVGAGVGAGVGLIGAAAGWRWLEQRRARG